jgi:hypothetical protein
LTHHVNHDIVILFCFKRKNCLVWNQKSTSRKMWHFFILFRVFFNWKYWWLSFFWKKLNICWHLGFKQFFLKVKNIFLGTVLHILLTCKLLCRKVEFEPSSVICKNRSAVAFKGHSNITWHFMEGVNTVSLRLYLHFETLF